MKNENYIPNNVHKIKNIHKLSDSDSSDSYSVYIIYFASLFFFSQISFKFCKGMEATDQAVDL